jgi:hypothetical protein
LGICRGLKKRNLLEVNEHFSDKQSVKYDPLSQPLLAPQPYFLSEGVRFGDLSQAEKAEFT